jgi:hypothetical protein
MAAFARHAQHKDVPYDEGCGGLMYDAWGGDEGIAWAQRKLEQIDREKEEMAKHGCKKDKDGKCKKAPQGYSEEEKLAIIEFAENDENGYYIGRDDLYW